MIAEAGNDAPRPSLVGPLPWPLGVSPPEAGTLPGLLDDAATTCGSRVAVTLDGDDTTYAQLARLSAAASGALRSLGIGPGAAVGLLAPNSVTWIASLVGAVRRGASVHAFSTWVKTAELDYLLRASGVTTLITVDRFGSGDVLRSLRELVPEAWAEKPGAWRSDRFPRLRSIAVIGDCGPAPGLIDWSARVDSAELGDEDLSRARHAPVVVYTSGSTQFPKAVPLTQRDMIENGFAIGERMHLTERDSVWLASPLFWSFGVANALMATMSHHARLVLDTRFEPLRAAETLRREGCTAAYLLPTMTEALRGEVSDQIRDITTLRTGLTIGRPDEVDRVIDELGIDGICNVYGSTEVFGNCCVTDRDDPVDLRRVSQGLPLPGVEVRIVSPEHRVLARGETGQIEVRGRVTPGYLPSADGTEVDSPFTDDGWYSTGDTGRLRSDGRLEFVGRHSDLIKTAGINVSPAEVEAHLRSHPAVLEAAVVGYPDDYRGEVPVAFVVVSGTLAEGELREHCRSALSGYKVPARFVEVDALPQTATGKLARKALRGLITDDGDRR